LTEKGAEIKVESKSKEAEKRIIEVLKELAAIKRKLHEILDDLKVT